jgi:hypothetical protein
MSPTENYFLSCSTAVVPYLTRLNTDFPLRRPGLDPSPGRVRFLVAKVALGRVFSEYYGFSCQSHHLRYRVAAILTDEYRGLFPRG